MYTITYSIKDIKGKPQTFYDDIRDVTDIVLSRASLCFRAEVENYKKYIKKNSIENCRTSNEYLLEVIMLGVLWRSYEEDAWKTPPWKTKLLRFFFVLRNSFPVLKPTIDKLRGLLISRFLYHKHESKSLRFNYDAFGKLLTWLKSTGEYKEEVKRLTVWYKYSKSSDLLQFYHLIIKTYHFANYFELACKERLGMYTKNVDSFVEKAKIEYKNREDFALATKREVEYYLNMVGAEILNRELKERFLKAKRKLVLLPTCMRINGENVCGSRINGLERKCIGCNSECNIGAINQQLKAYNIETFIIPHSSDFSRFLKFWKAKTDVSIVGVACVLNLLMGGYKMLDLNIASQCIYLDHCGCRNHWDPKGVATSINITHLHSLFGLPSIKDATMD